MENTLPQTQPYTPAVTPSHAGVPARAPLIPGFEIVAELGRGGMGVVYKAEQPSLRRSVAIKVLLTGTLAGDAERKRFRTEAEAAGSLLHPNIVRVHDAGEVDGQPYFSMDFVDGVSLARRLASGPMLPAEAARLVAAVAAAVQYAHERSILHRDLKPLNILLDVEGRPLITDFGLAKRFDESGQTGTGEILGTPSYMAPEQALGSKDLTTAVDVYGLGGILYDCLTGRPPFRAATPLQTITQVIESAPAPPRLLNPQVPRDLETICLKCLEKDPRRRYARAADVAADLERFLGGESIHARNLNLVQRLTRALEHSQYDVHFAAYGTMFLWLALVMFVPEVLITLIAWYDYWPAGWLPIVQCGRVAAFLAVVWHYRQGRLLPGSAAERQLVSIWGGYVVVCYCMGVSHRLIRGWDSWTAGIELQSYQALSCLTALAFFATASAFWGACYAFGAGFLMLAFAMSIDLRWAPIEFGVMWAFSLVAIGRRLRRLGAARSRSEESSFST